MKKALKKKVSSINATSAVGEKNIIENYISLLLGSFFVLSVLGLSAVTNSGYVLSTLISILAVFSMKIIKHRFDG